MDRAGLISAMLLLALAPVLIAQAPGNWDSVKQLAGGKEIRVTLMDGRNLRGEFQSATDDALMVATSKSQETLSRTMVTKVSSKGKSHRLRNALIGFGAGAGVGLILGAVGDANSCHPGLLGCFEPLGRNGLKETVTPLGAVIGGAVGALLPTGGWRSVYRVN
jgi:hypothetical protein